MALKHRNVTAEEMPSTKTEVGIQVSLGTFKLFYEAGSEDILWRERSEDVQNTLDERTSAKHEERLKSQWLL